MMPTLTETSPPVVVEVSVPKTVGYAGEWFPLNLTVERPDSWSAPVRLANIASANKAVQIDCDLLDRNEELRPGERYQLSIRLKVSQPRLVALEELNIEVKGPDGAGSEMVPLPPRKVDFFPAIGSEIAVQANSICTYEAGTKMEIVLRHEGTTTFRRLTVTVQPEKAVRAGKPTVQRPVFGPGDEEKFELVVDQNEIDVHLSADVSEQRSAASKTLSVAPPSQGRRHFRFLEPRRLSVDTITIYEKTAESQVTVESRQGVYPLRGGSQYEVIIRPQRTGVQKIRLRDVLGQVHLRDVEEDRKNGTWKQLIDVSMPDLFRKAEVLYYDVEVGGEHLTGEIAVCLEPAALRFWQVAGALGLALSAQGVFALARFLNKIDFDLSETIASFRLREDFNLLFLLSVPAFWGALKLGDWLVYRLRA
jgi:hypothetical protein